MDKKNKLLKNTLILGLGSIFTKALSFILMPLYTIYLAPTQYGTVDLVTTYIGYGAQFITLQLEWAAFRFLIDARGNKTETKKVISTIFSISVPIAIAVGALGTLLSITTNIRFIPAITLMVVATILLNTMLQTARGIGDNKKYAIAAVISGSCQMMLFAVLVIYKDMGVDGVLLSTAVAMLISSIFLFLSLRLHKYLSLDAIDQSVRVKLLKYSVPLIPEGIAWWVVNVSDRSIVAWALGVAANGIYAVANKYALILNVIFNVFHMSWSESASLHASDKDRSIFYSEIHTIAMKVFGSIGLLMIVSAPWIFSTLISHEYTEARQYVPILVIANYFYAIASMYGAIYIANKQTRQIAITTIAASVANIVINLSLVKIIGIYAAALTTAIAYVVMATYRHYDTKKYVKIKYDKNIVAPVFTLYIFSICLYYANNPIGNILNLLITGSYVAFIIKSTLPFLVHKVLASRKEPSKAKLARSTIEESLGEKNI